MDTQLETRMMPITPVSQPLDGCVRVPGSKSLTNRALLLAALADGQTNISNALFSDDSLFFASALETLGFQLSLDPENARMLVFGLGGEIPVGKASLFVGNAGTAARFLTALLSLGKGEFILDGDARMRQRPIGDLLDALSQLGAAVAPLNLGASAVCPPIKVTANGLAGGPVRIAGNISSQYLSALLMVAPYAKAPVDIELTTELNSKPFVDMTLTVMADFGVAVSREDYQRFHIEHAVYAPVDKLVVEPDASAASYFFAAPAICGGRVRVENMRRASRQGDIRFLDVLAEMGCQVSEDERGIQVSRSGELNGVDVDMRDIPDTAQTLAAVAPFAQTPTRIRGIASARVKETDRISAVCAELGRLGVRVDEHEDGMTIHPCENIKPVCVRTYNDHRMAMSFALIGLRADGICIEDPGCVSKTFPDFFTVLEDLR